VADFPPDAPFPDEATEHKNTKLFKNSGSRFANEKPPKEKKIMKRLMRLSIALILGIVGLYTVAVAPADASQLIEGMSSIKAYRIEFNNQIIGKVVVVGCDNPNPPPGYTAGQEYWTWSPGNAWRGTFTLVPDKTVPDHNSYSWEKFPHEHFDLSRRVPMPAISPDAGDRFYRVQAQSGSRWIDQGWMWLINEDNFVQEWYGQNLMSDLVGTGEAIRFTSAEPPAPGSKEIYLLIH
jgi:hypothetical protein